MFKKEFKVTAKWVKGESLGEGKPNPKTHTVLLEDKEPLVVSAAKQFKGDGSKLNPEDLFLSALASCHMMSYMYLCKKHAITLLHYTDETTGVLSLNSDGSGRFERVDLHPKVTIGEEGKVALALQLHQEANRLCFIANSSNTEINHHAEVLTVSEG